MSPFTDAQNVLFQVSTQFTVSSHRHNTAPLCVPAQPVTSLITSAQSASQPVKRREKFPFLSVIRQQVAFTPTALPMGMEKSIW